MDGLGTGSYSIVPASEVGDKFMGIGDCDEDVWLLTLERSVEG
jgi:hypothetical protein